MCYLRAWQNQIGVLCVITKTNKKQYNEYSHIQHSFIEFVEFISPGCALSDKAGIQKCYQTIETYN